MIPGDVNELTGKPIALKCCDRLTGVARNYQKLAGTRGCALLVSRPYVERGNVM
jgi:hypothetical protein